MIKVIILVAVLACIGPFFIKGPDGKPLMSVSDLLGELQAPTLPGSLPDAVLEKTPAATTTTVYKWQDDEGVWHFSDTPVGSDAEQFELDGAVNRMPAVTLPEAEVVQASTKQVATPPSMTATPNPVELMEQAKELKKIMEQRNTDLEALTGQQ